jgi:hypothetical protein
MLSPDDVNGFVAAIQEAAPIENAQQHEPDSRLMQSSHSGKQRQKLSGVGIGILMIVPLMAFFLYSPGPPKYIITSEGLIIHDRFFPVTVKAADVDVEHIKVVDVGTDPHWRLTARTGGIGLLHYKVGWFRVAGGEKVRMYRTTSPRLVLFPPKGKAAPVLFEANQPETFIREVRQAWR